MRVAVLCGLAVLLLMQSPRSLAQTDCLACHADASMTDASGHKISVDGEKFGKSVHGGFKCNDCHTDIKGYPHPEKPAKVNCATCHSD